MNTVFVAVGTILLLLACAIAALNFYIVVLRYPLHRLRGGNRENYQFVSFVPALGNLCILLALILSPSYPAVAAPWLQTLILVAFFCDLGGIPWAIIFMLIAGLQAGINRWLQPRK